MIFLAPSDQNGNEYKFMSARQTIPPSVIQEVKSNLALSTPLLTAWVIYALVPFAGTAMIAHLGPNVLAASVLVSTIWIAATTFCSGIFHSVTILVSQQFGANNNQAISEIMGQSFMMNILSWILVMLLTLCVPYFVQWSAPNPEVFKYATQYSHAIMWAAPGIIMLLTMEYFLSAIGCTKLCLWISILQVPFAIIVLYILIFGKCGLPAMGIRGIGYGQAISFTFITAILLIYLKFSRFTRDYHIYRYFGKVIWHYWIEILRIGLPIGFTYFIELVAFTIATYFISRFNATALAAHQIILQFQGVITCVHYALSQGTSIQVGQNVGWQDKVGVWFASYVGVGISLVVGLLIAVPLILFPDSLLKIDLNATEMQYSELIRQSIILFTTFGIYQIFDSIRVVEAGALRGLKETRFTMYVNIFCFFVFGLIAAYIFGIVLHGNAAGVWLGLTIGMGFGAFMLFLKLRSMVETADLARIFAIKK